MTALRYSAHWEEYFGSNNLTHCCSNPNLKKGFSFPKLWNVSNKNWSLKNINLNCYGLGIVRCHSEVQIVCLYLQQTIKCKNDQIFLCEAAYFECKCFLKLIICLNLDQLIQGKVSSLLFVIIHDRNNNWFSNRFKTAD